MAKHAPERFGVTWEWLFDLDISMSAISLYSMLWTYADRDTKKCWPSQELLAQRTNSTRKTVRGWLDELADSGAIKIEKRRPPRGGRPMNVYTLHTKPPKGA